MEGKASLNLDLSREFNIQRFNVKKFRCTSKKTRSTIIQLEYVWSNQCIPYAMHFWQPVGSVGPVWRRCPTYSCHQEWGLLVPKNHKRTHRSPCKGQCFGQPTTGDPPQSSHTLLLGRSLAKHQQSAVLKLSALIIYW